LQASLQPELAHWMAFESFKDMMREIQKGLSRNLFYAEWTSAWALASESKRKKLQHKTWKTVSAMMADLRRDPDILLQRWVRRRMDTLVTPAWRKKSGPWIFRLLNQAFSPGASVNDEAFLKSIFRCRLIDVLDPRLRRLVGYNQHDQYHAYTADTHILNLLLEFKRAFRSPRRLGGFAKWIQQCTPEDRRVLAWSCYYHDLAKGLAGDHEKIGAEYVHQDQKYFRQNEKWRDEVAWIVRYHLEFSRAAFRENPRDPVTLKKLAEIQLTPARIRRLALFTVLDIRATHPQAWTPWKEKLLLTLAESLSHPGQIQNLEKSKQLEKEFGAFPMALLELVGASRIDKDLRQLRGRSTEASFAVFPVRGGYWVRYFDPADRAGRLSFVLKVLFQAGCSVREALIQTIPQLGVYDWLMVESGLAPESLRRRLAIIARDSDDTARIPEFNWESVRWLSINEKSWTLLFRGRDQRGLLLATVNRLFQHGAQIRSARAQTWGQRVEDIIEIEPLADQSPDQWLATILGLQIIPGAGKS
jgi:[protein-PII] uridylyltransferase